jgi:hypothetical protein
MRKIIAYIISALFSLTLQAENVRVLFIGDSVTDGGWEIALGIPHLRTNATNGT